ncbi:FkbM family methyltransferase [Paenibacillus sp. J2TS4]|uniref:FkbM family methyltransferase n=1 Tax=Paenibacillus sp. J2TS4 TaxID=2807194 RepID=UPI001B1E1207|nr:FkbM family methyltransferase [Paenibacillus sp. J2TS4]GIP35608.1 hypothetical protein J2TS4_48180 [Paenibacillus sp. J2TS4]
MVDQFSINKISNSPNQIELLLNNCSHLLKNKNKPIILFGTGIIGLINLEYFKKFNLSGQLLFCDNNPSKWGCRIEGFPVISFEELRTKYSDSYIIITSFKYREQIFQQLKEHYLHNNVVEPSANNVIVSETPFFENFKDYFNVVNNHLAKFSEVYNLLADEYSRKVFYDRINYCITADNQYLIPLQSHSPQYFDPEILTLTENEIFIDGGAYTGDTVIEFLKVTNGNFAKIYSFEPEKTKHQQFMDKFSQDSNIKLLPYGLWRKHGVLRFQSTNSGTSQISNEGNIQIPVTSIDEILNGDPVTFIKMDIEGAELEALKGAQDSIRKYRPKLAICVYHNPLDIVEIPIFLNNLVPEYKFYLRHYNNSSSETVCYATIE